MLRTYDDNYGAAYLTKAADHATKQLLGVIQTVTRSAVGCTLAASHLSGEGVRGGNWRHCI
jgi:hypothetical protein